MRKKIAAFLVTVVCSLPLHAQTIDSITAVATYNNIGIQVYFNANVPQNAAIAVYVKESASAQPYAAAHPLSPIAADRFAGSVFFLKSNTQYSIKLSSTLFSSDQVLTTTTREETYINTSASVYHVSPNGNDGNNGSSLQNAFGSLAHAVSLAQAGRTILLHEGTYYEAVTMPRSGTASNPIIIRNAPGEHAILSGRDTSFSPVWTVHDAANHIYKTPYASQVNLAYHNGGHLFCYQDLAGLVANTYDMPGAFFSDGTDLYVLFPSRAAPAAADTITVPAYTVGIFCEQDYINVIGLEICYYGKDAYGAGVYFNNASYNRVDSCYLHHSIIGIALKRASHFNTFQNNRFFEGPIDTWPWEGVKSGTGYYEAGGFVVYSSAIINSGNVVRQNVFEHLFDGAHLYSETAPTTNMDFHDNIVASINDDCIETDGSGTNNRIYNNRFDKFLTGVSVAPAAIGPTYIFRNLFTRWETHSGYNGYPVKFNVNSSLTIDWVYLYHNTCFTDVAGQDGFLFKQYSNWSNIISRNNIYAGTNYALDSWSSQNPVDFDYDNLYTTHASRRISWAGTNYASVASFAGATGQETNGMFLFPDFTDTGNNDFSLSDTSPLIDKGAVIPGINDSFAGLAPDIGCFENGLDNSVTPGASEGLTNGFKAWPNPFNAWVRITGNKNAVVEIFNTRGVRVARLTGETAWNASEQPSGIYFCRIRLGATTISKRLVLLR